MTIIKADTLHKQIIGKTIVGILVERYDVLADVIIIYDKNENAKVLELAPFPDHQVEYKIENRNISHVLSTNDKKVYLLITSSKQYLINDQNQIIENSDQWVDHYLEPISNSFYRKNEQGHWYDIEGFKLEEKIFLKDHVLTSLDSKKSKSSLLFSGQSVFVSKHKQLIQIGKIVFNLDLEVVNYFGERITGLGACNVHVGMGKVVQQVYLGIRDFAFIDEHTHEPFLFGEIRITKHQGSHQYGNRQVALFETATQTIGIDEETGAIISLGDQPLHIESSEYINFNNAAIIKVSNSGHHFYFNLHTNEAFQPSNNQAISISEIDSQYIRIGQRKVFNVCSPNEEFVIYESDGRILTLNEGAITPQRIDDANIYKQHFGIATIDGQTKLFSKSKNSVLKFGKDALEVAELLHGNSDKFINAIDTHGNKLVLDIRHGFDNIQLAESDNLKIIETLGDIMAIGNKRLLRVSLETLGGKTERIIDINNKDLPLFTLPYDLMIGSDQEINSVFAGNPISQLYYNEETVIEGRTFISAEFISFTGKSYPVILDKETGQPLHLQGLGYKNELATNWNTHTLRGNYNIGENRMIGVNTLSESLAENQLLFSIQKSSSWLAFGDGYLPIFRQYIDVEDTLTDTWDYYLLELRETAKEKEYIAVEKAAPFRILAQKKGTGYIPKLITTKEKTIKSPEGMNAIQKFFLLGKGTLVAVE